MNVNLDLRNVQEQLEDNSEQVRKYAHKAALAYTGLWAMAYDSAKAGLDGSKELLEKAEKRGEEVEQDFNKQYNKYYDQAMNEFKKVQERYAENLSLDEVGKTVTKTVNENAKAVQGNVNKVLNRVGIAGNGEDIRETVIEVTASVEQKLVAPIKGYDELTAKELVAKFDTMTQQNLELVRQYEIATKNRVTVLRELDERLGEPAAA